MARREPSTFILVAWCTEGGGVPVVDPIRRHPLYVYPKSKRKSRRFVCFVASNGTTTGGEVHSAGMAAAHGGGGVGRRGREAVARPHQQGPSGKPCLVVVSPSSLWRLVVRHPLVAIAVTVPPLQRALVCVFSFSRRLHPPSIVVRHPPSIVSSILESSPSRQTRHFFFEVLYVQNICPVEAGARLISAGYIPVEYHGSAPVVTTGYHGTQMPGLVDYTPGCCSAVESDGTQLLVSNRPLPGENLQHAIFSET